MTGLRGRYRLVMAAVLVLVGERAALAQCTSIQNGRFQCTVATGDDSKFTLPIFGLKAGDFVDIVATPNSDDPNETGENEPLEVEEVLGSSVVQSYTIPGYGAPTPLRFTVVGTGGALFRAWIHGYDSDESATLSVAVNKTNIYPLEVKQDAAFLQRAYANESSGDFPVVGGTVACQGRLLATPPQRLLCTVLFIGNSILRGWHFIMGRLPRIPLIPISPRSFNRSCRPLRPWWHSRG